MKLFYGLTEEQAFAFIKEQHLQDVYPIQVWGMRGEYLGRVKTFGEAKAIHESYLKEQYPNMLPLYMGVNMSEDDWGKPEFYDPSYFQERNSMETNHEIAE